MATQRSRASKRRIVVLDGNRLGLVGGAVVGAAVMALSFFVQESNWTTTAVRVGWSFVIAYGVTFMFVNIIVHTRMAEAARLEALGAEEAEAMADSAKEETDDPIDTNQDEALGEPPNS